MSININVNGMKFSGQSLAERVEYEKRCKNRLLKVREKSKEIAQELRDKVRVAKEEELNKLQKLKEKELNDWKRKKRCQIEDQIDCCIQDFGNAHINAIDASCEEGETLREIRDEQHLMAASRGRVAMLQEQRKREKDAEQRLQAKKRKQQKTIGIQADFLTQQCLSDKVRKNRNLQIDLTRYDSCSEDEEIIAQQYSSKPNVHKYQSVYDPQNYTSNSLDSNTNSNESDPTEDTDEINESLEFNQITNLLKQRMQEIYDAPKKKLQQKAIIEVSSESSSDIDILPLPAEKVLPKMKTSGTKIDLKKSPQKSILKSQQSSQKSKSTAKKTSPSKKSRNKLTENSRVRYLDIHNKYQTSYEPKKDLVIRNEVTRSSNARVEAQIQTDQADYFSKMINDDVLKQLRDIRSHEALEKEKIRRDYEKLRLEMDEIAKQEQELRTKTNMSRQLSRDQLLRQEENRQKKMNEAVEKAFEKNVITCPPVAREKEKSCLASEVNVATNKNSEVSNLVKKERLKDLLEKINHQKRLILNELEKNEDIPGPDLHRVMEYLKELEQEKEKIDTNNDEKFKKFEELNEREQNIREREDRLENKLRELFNKQLKREKLKDSETPSSTCASTVSESSNEVKKVAVPPVEIIIKVQNPSKSPRKKKKKTIRCLDSLSQAPKKVYPKTPIKKRQPLTEKPQLTSSKITSRPILKRPEDNSSSTSYRSIPEQLKNAVSSDIPDVPLKQPPAASNRKTHHKLNPALMHYITRLLGMNTDIGIQLNVDVSSVATPGSSTIATSGNNSAILVEPSFDANRLDKLQQFIDDNHSFLNEVNETIKSVQQEQINEKRMDCIWRDTLNKKKPKSVATSTSGTKQSTVRESETGKKAKEKDSSDKTSIVGSEKPSINPVIPSRVQESKISHPKQIDPTMLTNYAEYTANCRQRIANLSQMMEQVRQERLKLIENSLSSGEFNNFTEYREIVQQKIISSDQKDSSRDDPPSEEINNILQKQTRPFGVSKDSGISGSRPVTSSDFRDSPDTRVISEEAANLFKPIKAPKIKITASEGDNEGLKEGTQQKPQLKPQRPPLSLKSFSPAQVEKQHEPHELSTIAEIETPTASKLNIIPDDGNFAISNLIHSFPDFEEYAKNVKEHYLIVEQEPFPELGDLKDALPDINVKTFVNPNDFNLEITKEAENKDEIKSNNSSLSDIMEELKRRNLITKSFAIIEDDPVEKVPDDKTTPTATIKLIEPQSPRKPAPQSRIIIKTPVNSKNTGLIQVDNQKTPTKKKQVSVLPQAESPKSNDTLSGIQEIEKDFQGAGMSWAASLLKRSEEAKKQRESSSSSEKVEIEIQMPDVSSSTSSGGRPMNLRDFLRRELMAKSQKDKYLSDESSLSSQFMRSLLNASSGSTSSDRAKKSDSSNTKVRTSTPVNMKSSDKLTTGKTTSSQQLFGPEAESVSTLKDSEASESDKR